MSCFQFRCTFPHSIAFSGASLPKPIAAKSVRRTFASVLVASGSASSSTPAPDQSPLVPSTQYLGDFEYRQPTDIPEQCEVTSQSLQDAALQPFYSDLPRLRCVNPDTIKAISQYCIDQLVHLRILEWFGWTWHGLLFSVVD